MKPVKAGATVTVKNEDRFAHTVTADNGEFNTDNIDGGKTVTFTAPRRRARTSSTATSTRRCTAP